MNQNGRSLEIDNKISLTLLINKYKWHVIQENYEITRKQAKLQKQD